MGRNEKVLLLFLATILKSLSEGNKREQSLGAYGAGHPSVDFMALSI